MLALIVLVQRRGCGRGKFDGVRCAVLLLAFRKLSKSLQMHSDAPSRFWHVELHFLTQ